MLDAPVSGGEIGAKSGSLSIMVGGDEATFARVRRSTPRVTRRANSTFSKTVILGRSLKSWKTVPILRRRSGR